MFHPGRGLGGPRARRSNMHFTSSSTGGFSSSQSSYSPSNREAMDPIAGKLEEYFFLYALFFLSLAYFDPRQFKLCSTKNVVPFYSFLYSLQNIPKWYQSVTVVCIYLSSFYANFLGRFFTHPTQGSI